MEAKCPNAPWAPCGVFSLGYVQAMDSLNSKGKRMSFCPGCIQDTDTLDKKGKQVHPRGHLKVQRDGLIILKP